MKIFKYPLRVDDRQTVQLPKGAELLTVQVQHGSPCLWALVDEAAETESRVILMYGTGHALVTRSAAWASTWAPSNSTAATSSSTRSRESEMDLSTYRAHGYNDREDYLSCMAEDYGLDLEEVVRPLADLLGPNEDFDGLISALEDESSK